MPRVPRKPRTRPAMEVVPPRAGAPARGADDGGFRGELGGLAARRTLQAGLRCGGLAVTRGDTPSKKNSKRIFASRSSGRAIVLPSVAHESWKSGNVWDGVRLIKTPLFSPTGIAAIAIDLWQSTARTGDCTNKAESVLDLLVDTAIIADDNWREVPMVCVAYNGVDRENPRAEVTFFYA